eukprot:9054252-Pyramimonas_sp.AAC.1
MSLHPSSRQLLVLSNLLLDAPCALHSRVGAGEGAWANAHSFRGWGATMRSRARKTTGRFAIIVIAVVVQS